MTQWNRGLHVVLHYAPWLCLIGLLVLGFFLFRKKLRQWKTNTKAIQRVFSENKNLHETVSKLTSTVSVQASGNTLTITQGLDRDARDSLLTELLSELHQSGLISGELPSDRPSDHRALGPDRRNSLRQALTSGPPDVSISERLEHVRIARSSSVISHPDPDDARHRLPDSLAEPCHHEDVT
jgi:hypothetical protein